MRKGEVLKGNQFVFVNPEEEVSVLLFDGHTSKKVTVKEPKVFSRFNKGISVNKTSFPPLILDKQFWIVVSTTKKIYHPHEEVPIFAFGEGEAELTLKKDGKLIYSHTVTLDGCYTETIEDLEEGEYEVTLKTEEGEAKAKFSTISYSLSLLSASFIHHRYDNDLLSFKIKISLGGSPYHGNVKVNLFCGFCNYSVAEKKLQSFGGILEGDFSLKNHTGPFSLIITTASGDTTTIDVPSTESSYREKVKVCDMGDIIEAGLHQGINTFDQYRGIYLDKTGSSTSPFTIDKIFGKEAKITLNNPFHHIVWGIFNPSTLEYQEFEKQNTQEGEVISVEIPYPHGILTIGAIGEKCYETYTLLISPENMDLKVKVPSEIKPEEEFTLSVESSREGILLFLICDEKIQKDLPSDKFARLTFQNIRKNIGKLYSGEVKPYSPKEYTSSFHPSSQIISFMEPVSIVARAKPIAITDMSIGLGGIEFETIDMEIPLSESISPKEELPPKLPLKEEEVILFEITPFRGKLAKKITLREPARRYQVYAFLINGYDFAQYTTIIQATSKFYIDWDIPTAIFNGDKITARAYVKAEEPSKFTLKTQDISLTQHIEKADVIEFPITKTGKIEAYLEYPEGKIYKEAYIEEIGRKKLTLSHIEILENEEKKGKILVYPNPTYLIKDVAKSLLKYPFGCAEQTSAKLYGLAILKKSIEKGILKDNEEIDVLIQRGIDRLSLFHKEGLFSLWEESEVDVEVSIQVLKNILPLLDTSFKKKIEPLILPVAQNLIEKGIKDNRLLPLSKNFKAPLTGVTDASLWYFEDIDKKKACDFIIQNTLSDGDIIYWEDPKCWAGTLEATSCALKVMWFEEKNLFKKGFAFLGAKMENGMLHSTSDTCALLSLLNTLDIPSKPRVILDGEEKILEKPQWAETVYAIDPVMTRQDVTTTVNLLKPQHNFKAQISLDKTQIKTADKINLEVNLLEESTAPLLRIFLPGNLASPYAGGNREEIYIPLKQKHTKIEIYGIRTGTGKIHTVISDMYDAKKVGVLPAIEVTVKEF